MEEYKDSCRLCLRRGRGGVDIFESREEADGSYSIQIRELLQIEVCF